MFDKKALLIFLGLFALILSAAYLFWTMQPQGEILEIILTENGFLPNEITIKNGDKIKFSTNTNKPFWPASDLHPTHGIYPEFDPLKPIDPDKSWTFQFLKSGRWKFHDHLSSEFRGSITVN